MIIEAKRFRLKDGREAVLRCPREEDVPGVLDYLFVTAGETEFILRYPEECGKYTHEGEKELFERWNASDDELALVCTVDGSVAGMCNLARGKNEKTRHRATVAIALLRAFWGLGMGTVMLEELLRAARSLEGVTQAELSFIEGNVRARALYEKLGFRICGVQPDAIRLRDGTLLAEYNMIKKL